MKAIKLIAALALMGAVVAPAQAKKMSDLKIYINPGHGGYTSNDRPIQIYPFAQNDTLGYWESKSNLYKGLHMYHILDSLGAKPMLSRVKNTEEDDRNLYSISSEANEFGADLFFSIHSNAGEDVNYLLMLYREETIGTPRYPENVTISEIVARNLHSNEMSNWTRKPWIAGDLDFYKNMWQGGLGVLRRLYVPGLLSEGGMHEHRPQAYRLMNDDYWWLEAWHFVHAIMEFYDTEDRFVTGNVAGVVYDDHNLREMDVPTKFTMIGRDKLAPVNGCFIELLDASGKQVQKRTTDNMYNGVFVFRNVTPGNYTVRMSKDGYYTEEIPVTVKADEVTYCNTPLNMKREYNLGIVNYGPKAEADGLVSCSAPIELEFNCDVDEESLKQAFSITPAVAGHWKFTDNNHKATYSYDVSLDPGVTYTVKIATSAKTPDKHFATPGLAEEFVNTFTTRNRSRLAVTDQFPVDGGQLHYASPTLEIRFDNKIKATGIKDLLKVTDSKGKTIAMNTRASQYNTLGNGFGNAVLALSGDLVEGETYTVVLSQDLRDAETLPMANDLTFKFVAKDVTKEASDGMEVKETFDNTNVLTGDLDASKGMAVKPSVGKSTSPRLFGEAAVKLSYNFAESHDGEAIWNYTAATPVQFETNDLLGLYVNGDFSNHELWVGVTSGTDTKWQKMCDLNFRGWEYHEVKCDNLEAGYVYDLDKIKIVQTESPITQKGSIVLDDLVAFKNENQGVSSIVADSDQLRVYPNPASTVLNVDSASPIERLQLINVAGVTVATANGTNALNVEDVTTGHYLLRAITTDGRLLTHRVVIAH